jgi:nicotinamidase/pyrazinamidase
MSLAPADAALVVIDMQNDFVLPTGSLSVSGAPSIVPVVNSLRSLFRVVVWTQDWHPPDHVSFVGNHPGHKAYDVVQAAGYLQCLFPAHCVADSSGAAIHAQLDVRPQDVNIKKGTKSDVDSYSCFFDVVKSHSTNADQELKKLGITTLYVLGVATDYCVKSSVIDALALGYKVFVIEDGIAAVIPADGVKAIEEMKTKGAVFVRSSDVKF